MKSFAFFYVITFASFHDNKPKLHQARQTKAPCLVCAILSNFTLNLVWRRMNLLSAIKLISVCMEEHCCHTIKTQGSVSHYNLKLSRYFVKFSRFYVVRLHVARCPCMHLYRIAPRFASHSSGGCFSCEGELIATREELRVNPPVTRGHLVFTELQSINGNARRRQKKHSEI